MLSSETSTSSSSLLLNERRTTTTSPQQHSDASGTITTTPAVVVVVPSVTTNDPSPPPLQPRTMWRRIFPSWKGPNHHHHMNHSNNNNNHNNSSRINTNTSATTTATTATTTSTSNSSMIHHNPTSHEVSRPPSTVQSDPVVTKLPNHTSSHEDGISKPSPLPHTVIVEEVLPSNSVMTLSTNATVPPPPPPSISSPQLLLPPVHRNTTTTTTSTTSNSNATTNTTTTTIHNNTTTTPAAATATTHKLLPPQSPRMDRPPKLPPSIQHQSQRSLTNTTTTVLGFGGLPPPQASNTMMHHSSLTSSSLQQHRPSAVSNHASQRNLSFSSTGSRHRRSSGDWPILTSLQQLSLSSPNDDTNEAFFDTHSLATADTPYFNNSNSNGNRHTNGVPPPPPPPPPIAMIDQPKCERRISVLSDFGDDDNDNDDDRLFDLSSDEEDDPPNDANRVGTPTKQQQQQQHSNILRPHGNLTYQYSYDDSAGGHKSKDSCSVSPTTVILPPPPVPIDATTSTAAVSSTSSSVGTNTPDWMLEWAGTSTSVSGTMDTPTAASALLKKCTTPETVNMEPPTTMCETAKDPIKIVSPRLSQESLPLEENETASCSTSTVNSNHCHSHDLSSTDETSLSISEPSDVLVYLPIEPIPSKPLSFTKTTKTNTPQKVVFCGGWAVVLWNNDLERDSTLVPNEYDATAGTLVSLPTNRNYDESIYYIELVQGGILRCTSLVDGGRMDKNSDENQNHTTVIEMSLCPTTTTAMTSSSNWSIVPVCPATAGVCLAIQYTSMQPIHPSRHESNDDRCGDGGQCFILPVNITKRTMDRICNVSASISTGKRVKSKKHANTFRHSYWLQPQPAAMVTNESRTATKSEDHTLADSNDQSVANTEYAPQAQHDAVIFLRFALDAALQSSKL